MQSGGVSLLIDGRDDVAAWKPERARVIINTHVDDARATAQHLDSLGVTSLAEAGYREPAGAWSGTVLDPDGNYVQIIELADAYRSPAGGACCERATARWQAAPSQLARRRRISSARGGSMPGNRACSQPRRHRAVCATSTEAEASSGGARAVPPCRPVPAQGG